MMVRVYFWICVLAVTVGASTRCRSRQPRHRVRYVHDTSVIISPVSVVDQQEARWPDIAIPLNARVLPNSIADNVYAYKIHLSRDALVAYYKREMERAGWECTIAFAGQERLFVFEKPYKTAAISIRPVRSVRKDEVCDVYIFVSPRESHDDRMRLNE